MFTIYLSTQDVVKMLNSSKLLSQELSLHCLKYRSVKRDLKDLNETLENMASASINYEEFVEIPKRNILIKQLLDDMRVTYFKHFTMINIVNLIMNLVLT